MAVTLAWREAAKKMAMAGDETKVFVLFVRASLRAKRVHQAMQCRGFTGRFHALDIYPSHWLNPCFLTLAAACGLGLSVLDLIWL